MDINDIQKKINSINWSFDFTINYDNDTIRPFNCRKYYSYPATFIPEIPYTLIEMLSEKGDVVLDPFGGIGTTFMQALSLERFPFSFDINPIASDVCSVLYYLFNPNCEWEKIQKQLLDWCNDYDAAQNYCDLLTARKNELKGWYEQNTLNELAFLFNKYEHTEDENLRRVLSLVLPSILTTLSSQNKGWAYIADNVKPKCDELRKKNVFDQFKLAVKALLTDVENQVHNLPETYREFYQNTTELKRVIEDSVTNTVIKTESVDLIVTSPPYPRMIDYIKSQRLAFYFSELDFRKYVGNEIGARYRRSRNDALSQYEDDMEVVNSKLRSLLKPGGYICMVLPDYSEGDNRKGTIEKIVKSYEENGFKEISKIRRYIPSHKRTLSIQWAKLVNEHIYILRKDEQGAL